MYLSDLIVMAPKEATLEHYMQGSSTVDLAPKPMEISWWPPYLMHISL